ncbi:unnamed protein product [Polarella glacialis]|uniref:SMODS and SLOG-associating 2TM effector domain-containing protein n=1 Tax=Polarella glacialis TaxID=89957 RepID=A0A813HH47_POLGL|nr:unnamed protein product [Polarella glacialis]
MGLDSVKIIREDASRPKSVPKPFVREDVHLMQIRHQAGVDLAKALMSEQIKNLDLQRTFFKHKCSMHTMAFDRYWRYYHSLAVPALIISILIAAVSALEPESVVVVTVLSSINTCILALLQMLEYQTAKNAHLSAAKLFDKLRDQANNVDMQIRRKFDSCMDLECDSCMDLDSSKWKEVLEETRRIVEDFSKDSETKTSELAYTLPPLPVDIQEKILQRFLESKLKDDTDHNREVERGALASFETPRRQQIYNREVEREVLASFADQGRMSAVARIKVQPGKTAALGSSVSTRGQSLIKKRKKQHRQQQQRPTLYDGLVYTKKGTQVGMGSFHFESESDCCICFEGVPEDDDSWKLEVSRPPDCLEASLQPLPSRMEFVNASFDAHTRLFRGDIVWSRDGHTFRGAEWQRYEIIFSLDKRTASLGVLYMYPDCSQHTEFQELIRCTQFQCGHVEVEQSKSLQDQGSDPGISVQSKLEKMQLAQAIHYHTLGALRSVWRGWCSAALQDHGSGPGISVKSMVLE